MTDYSLEYTAKNTTPCITCGDAVGQGIIGWKKTPRGGPVCDRCLLDGDRDLGLFLWTMLILRELGQITASSLPHHRRTCMLSMAAVVQMYEEFSGSAWANRSKSFLALLLRSGAGHTTLAGEQDETTCS